MKKYKLLTIAPMLTLLAAGCSTPIAMQSTEYDDMYYSSSDKTAYVEPEATTSQRYNELTVDEAFAEGEVLNPEYSESAARTDDYVGDEYYDGREYDARNNWYQPSYSFVDPYWGAAYAPRMSSIAFYDPFYDPFFGDPFYYNSFRRSPYWGGGFNRGLNVSLGYGMGMGMGMPMAWGGGFYNQPMMGMGGWWPNSYGYGHYNGFRNGFNNGFYGGNPYYGGIYDRPVVIGNPVRIQNSPRNSRSAVVTDNPALRRPARGGVNEGESIGRQTIGSESVGRPARRGETVTSPTRTEGNVRAAEGEKRALPNRPSRTRRTPAINNQQEQRRATPARIERRTRTQEYRQPQQRQQQRVRPTESRPTRTYESRPTRTYESPVRSSPVPRSSGSSGSSGGGGRPPRGGN